MQAITEERLAYEVKITSKTGELVGVIALALTLIENAEMIIRRR